MARRDLPHHRPQSPWGAEGSWATSLNGVQVVATIPPQPAGSVNEVAVEMG